MYELSGVTKDYKKGRATVHALAGVDLRISDGEWLAIQGPTGHGKTTLLQVLGGLDRPTSGVVDFDGQNLAALRESQVTRASSTRCRSPSADIRRALCQPRRHVRRLAIGVIGASLPPVDLADQAAPPDVYGPRPAVAKQAATKGVICPGWHTAYWRPPLSGLSWPG
jgi:ABC-type glutathione transport system ATPase component